MNYTNKYNITLGTDPEVFFENEIECVSAEGIVPGTKQEPFKITEKGHAIQLDNVSAEFNIPPCSNHTEWVENINISLNYIKDLAKQNNLKISNKASYIFDSKYLQTKNAMEFGCSPDYDVYTESINLPPNAENKNLRSCGGHVAIGYPDSDLEKTENIVKMFDIFVVVPSLLIDKDEQRRELYGKAGAFRFTPFGVECRSLSNFWIHSEKLMVWVFAQTIHAVNLVLDNEKEYIEKYSEMAKNAINNNDKKLALKIVEELKIELPM